MLLADIGNRFAHLYDGNFVFDLSIDDLISKYSTKKLFFINVNPKNLSKLNSQNQWVNLSKYINLSGSYEGMGIDRQVLLLSKCDGIYVDAGSAITIDKKLNNQFVGGTRVFGELKNLTKRYLKF